MSKFDLFDNTEGRLRCPICQGILHLEDRSLLCADGHCFDIAKAGYVNFVPNMRASQEYDCANFAARRQILEGGFYDQLADAVADFSPASGVVLDVGCGEGFYAKRLAQNRTVYAFDLSKDSIQLAAKGPNVERVRWLVADLANIPLTDKSVDVIVDIYSPANYDEFKRILKPNGRIVKVVPTADHVRELRQLVKEQDYSNQRLLDLFEEHFEVVETRTITQTSPLSDAEKEAFLQMTPLLFHKDKAALQELDLPEITIAGQILVGKLN